MIRGPIGSQIVRERIPVLKCKQTQQFIDHGRVKGMTWGIELKGIQENGDNVLGTETITIGKTPYCDKYMFILPASTHYAIRLSCDHECNISMHAVDSDCNIQRATWHAHPGKTNWIKECSNGMGMSPFVSDNGKVSFYVSPISNNKIKKCQHMNMSVAIRNIN